MKSCSNAPHRVAKAILCQWAWLGCLLLVCVAARADWPPATNLWSFEFTFDMVNNETLSTPAVAPDGTIYAGAFDGKLHALGPDGKEKWKFQAGNEIKSSPAIGDDGTIYFGARDHRLYAVTPAGKLKWTFTTGAWVDSSPGIAVDGTICFGSWDKNFYALNPDGSLKWKFAVGGIVDSSPAMAADGTIYFGAHNKKFYALDAAGKLRWTFLTGAEITSSPAIADDGSVYFSSTDGNLYRLKPDGTELWRYHTGGGSDGSPALAENGSVVIAAGFKEFIISPAGALVWTWTSPYWMNETPLIAAGNVCWAAPWNQIAAVTPEGAGLWYGSLPVSATTSLVMGGQGQVYCCCARFVEAMQPPMALLPAKSSWPMFRADARHTGRVKVN